MKTIKLLTALCFIMIINQGYAQKDITLELIKTEDNTDNLKENDTPPIKGYRKVNSVDKGTIGYESPYYIDKKNTIAKEREIVFKNGKKIKVAPLPITIVSEEAGVILKHGNREDKQWNKPAELIIYNLNGKIIKSILEKHNFSQIATSDKGKFVLGGSLSKYGNDYGSFITLYDKVGKENYRTFLGEGNFLNYNGLTISPKGNYVACNYRKGRSVSENYSFSVLNNRGEVILRKVYNKELYRMIFSNNEKYLIITAENYIALIDLLNKKLIWEQSVNYRLGKFPIEFFEEKNVIALITSKMNAECKIHLLDFESGEDIYTVNIPERIKNSLSSKIINKKDEETLTIKSNTKKYIYQIKQK
ncbi:MAG: hypothetical protein GY756_00685 [bacterium]|nr:hypothetical protein [bacterium]